MRSTPLVSIIMPVYNGQPFLIQAVDSIVRQTYSDFELIIIDDGSMDRSLDIVRSYNDPRIRLLCGPHQGLVPSLNRGIASAQGVYIARMDADDVSDSQRVQLQVEYMKAHPCLAMVGSSALLIDAEGEPTGESLRWPVGG